MLVAEGVAIAAGLAFNNAGQIARKGNPFTKGSEALAAQAAQPWFTAGWILAAGAMALLIGSVILGQAQAGNPSASV